MTTSEHCGGKMISMIMMRMRHGMRCVSSVRTHEKVRCGPSSVEAGGPVV